MTARRSTTRAGVGRTTQPDKILAFSPSGAIENPDALERAAAHIERMGLKLAIDRGALLRSQRFAGTDRQRVAAFERAAASDAALVIATRGGYGLTRLLGQLDYRALARSGRQWMGLSDFTAFHLAMLARAKAVTWAGPCLLGSFGRERFEDIDPTTREGLLDVVTGRLEAIGFRCIGPKGFEAEGTLWGGNLTVLCSLVGTPYFPRVDGGILFLEDVNEHPYRIERMLTQLLFAGVLDRQQAILLGAFSGYQTYPNDRGFDLRAVQRWLAGQTSTPIITGLPFGHVDPVMPLPHGARVGLAVEGRTCFLIPPQTHDHRHDDDHAHGNGHGGHGH